MVACISFQIESLCLFQPERRKNEMVFCMRVMRIYWIECGEKKGRKKTKTISILIIYLQAKIAWVFDGRSDFSSFFSVFWCAFCDWQRTKITCEINTYIHNVVERKFSVDSKQWMELLWIYLWPSEKRSRTHAIEYKTVRKWNLSWNTDIYFFSLSVENFVDRIK